MAQAGVLLIHGLMGSPNEYENVEEVLQESGYRTKAISLPGHGDFRQVQALHHVDTNRILEHCSNEYNAFAADHDGVVILGHSLGGICALITAAEQFSEPKDGFKNKLKGVISFAAPLEHAYWINRTNDLFKLPVAHLIPALKYLPEQLTTPNRPEIPFWKFPKLKKEAAIMMGILKEKLPKIQAPVLLAHSPFDLTIPYVEMEKIAQFIQDQNLVKMHTFQNCGHQIFPRSRESEDALALILDFLCENCPVSIDKRAQVVT